MGLENITVDVVLAALAEHDQTGLEEFCDRYEFDRFRNYVIAVRDRRYGTRVIAAAAHGYLPGRVPLLPEEVADEDLVSQILKALGFQVKELRPPKWTREELVLACSQLFANNREAQRAGDPAVKDLAALLQELPFHAPQDRGHNFRSINSVQRKLFDLMTSLPGYSKKKTRGGSLDEVIVAEFLTDEVGMHEQAAAVRAEHAAVKAWALFSEGEREYEGNIGYLNVLGSRYVYDNKMGNYQNLLPGHVIAIQDGDDVVGVGRISWIERQDDVPKLQKGCPHCGSKFDPRKALRPKYRCREVGCNHLFDQPAEGTVLVTQYVAHYGGSWRALDGAITADELKRACTGGTVQEAIRPLDVAKLGAMLQRLEVQLPTAETESSTAAKVEAVRRAVAKERTGDESAADDKAWGSRGDDWKAPKGGRREAKTKARNGQRGFRKKLIKRYGHVCAVTGPCPVEVLEAAHLRDFAEHETHNLDEGVLLRADVHLLFDNDLLAVDPTTWRVVLAPSLANYPDYDKLGGVEFVKGPCEKAITDHFLAITATWT